MKDKFFAMGNSRGLKRHPFVHAVFMHLYQTTKGLHVKADAARVVAMLDELFDQIGGQGGGRLGSYAFPTRVPYNADPIPEKKCAKLGDFIPGHPRRGNRSSNKERQG